MNELLKKSAAEQSKAIRNKEVSAVELTNAAFDRISALDEKLGAFNSLTNKLPSISGISMSERIRSKSVLYKISKASRGFSTTSKL